MFLKSTGTMDTKNYVSHTGGMDDSSKLNSGLISAQIELENALRQSKIGKKSDSCISKGDNTNFVPMADPQKHHRPVTQMADEFIGSHSSNETSLFDSHPVPLNTIRSSEETAPGGTTEAVEPVAIKPSYVDIELEKQIFTYGPYVPSKIDSAQVPRPSNLAKCEPKAVIPETSKINPLIPTLESHRILDTGTASPLYMRVTLPDIPIFSETLSRVKIPFAMIVQPFAQNPDENVPLVDLVSQIGEIDLSKQNLIRCPKCAVYFNPAMEVEGKFGARVCNFCYTSFNLTSAESVALESLKCHTSKISYIPPIMRGSVDFVAPENYYKTLGTNSESMTNQFASMLSKTGAMASLCIPLAGSAEVASSSPAIYNTYGLFPSASSKSLVGDSAGGGAPMSVSHNSKELRQLTEPEGTPDICRDSSMNVLPRVKQGSGENEDFSMTAAYVFVIESTITANNLGVKKCVIDALRGALMASGGFRIRFCVITFDCIVHLYVLNDGVFTVNIVTEVDEIFSPSCFDDVFISFDGLEMNTVEEYLDNILKSDIPITGSQSCGNSALHVAVKLLSDNKVPGTVSIFYSMLPDIGLGTFVKPGISNSFDMEADQKVYYDGLIKMCYDVGIAVDAYICAQKERIPGDVVLQYICQQTAGHCCYFPVFYCDTEYYKIMKNIHRMFTVPSAYNCELKLRCTKSIHIKEILCPFSNTRSIINNSTLKIPRISPDTALAFSLTMDDLIDNTHSKLYMQCACMYNNSFDGRKLIRVHTSALNVTTSVNQIFKNADCDAIINLCARRLAYKFIKKGIFDKKTIQDEIVGALCSYRHLCAPSTPNNQLILPDNLKLLPAYLNALFKFDQVKSGVCGVFLQKLLRFLLAPVNETSFVYSRCYCLHRSLYDENDRVPEGGWRFECDLVPSSTSSIFSDGIYLIDDGQKLLLYFGPHAKWVLLQELFGKDLVLNESTSNCLKLLESNQTCKNLMECIEKIRGTQVGTPYRSLKILPYSSKYHSSITMLLLEDETRDEPAYINFLVTLHRLIRRARAELL